MVSRVQSCLAITEELSVAERKPRLLGKVTIITGPGSRAAGIGNGKTTAIRFAPERAAAILVDNIAERALET